MYERRVALKDPNKLEEGLAGVLVGPHLHLHCWEQPTDLVVGREPRDTSDVRATDERLLVELSSQPGRAIGEAGDGLKDGST